MANPVENVQNMSPQTEVAMAALRQPAINALLNEGREATFKTTGHRTPQGLQLDTVDTGTRAASTMMINGNRDAAPAGNIRATVKGEISLTGGPGAIAGGHMERTYPMFPGWVGTTYDEYKSKLSLTDAAGRPVMTMEPAKFGFASKADGSTKMDPNGQPVRLADSTSGDNCGFANPGNPNNRRVTCNFVLNDPTRGELSYSETREQNANGSISYRSVLRDMKGGVLGIVYNDFNLDQNGDVISATTSARRPQEPKT